MTQIGISPLFTHFILNHPIGEANPIKRRVKKSEQLQFSFMFLEIFRINSINKFNTKNIESVQTMITLEIP